MTENSQSKTMIRSIIHKFWVKNNNNKVTQFYFNFFSSIMKYIVVNIVALFLNALSNLIKFWWVFFFQSKNFFPRFLTISVNIFVSFAINQRWSYISLSFNEKTFLNGLYNSFRNPSRNDLSFTQNFDIKSSHRTLIWNVYQDLTTLYYLLETEIS